MRSYPQSYTEFSFTSMSDVPQKDNVSFTWMAWYWAKGQHPNYPGLISNRSYSAISLSNTISILKISSSRSFIVLGSSHRAPPLQLQEPLNLSKYRCTIQMIAIVTELLLQSNVLPLWQSNIAYSQRRWTSSFCNSCIKSCFLLPVTFFI